VPQQYQILQQEELTYQ